MPCGSCGGKRQVNNTRFEVTLPNGTKKTVNNEIEASAAVARAGGGSYKPVNR